MTELKFNFVASKYWLVHGLYDQKMVLKSKADENAENGES